MSDCVTGCKRYYGGEVKHHKDCPYYEGSISQIMDKQKGLLNKYMRLVMSEEDVSYLSCINDGWNYGSPKFTDEEIELLKEIEKEIVNSEID